MKEEIGRSFNKQVDQLVENLLVITYSVNYTGMRVGLYKKGREDSVGIIKKYYGYRRKNGWCKKKIPKLN